LKSAKKSHAHTQRLERWSLKLRVFEFDVVHHPGRCNQHADALSRRPVGVVALHSPIDMTDLSSAQQDDPILSTVYNHLMTNQLPSLSVEGNQYLLVVQYYFSKWPFTKAIPDQAAERIVQVLRDDVFALIGPS